MLAYAATRPAPVDRGSHPNTMLVIIGVHVAVLAAVMSAKMDLPVHKHLPPLIVDFIRTPPPPPPQPMATPTQKSQLPLPRPIDRPIAEVPMPPVQNPQVDTTTPVLDPGAITTGGTALTPELPRPLPTAAKSAPHLLTSPAELKPPYPASKLLTGEEAALRLRLTIDERGRVIAVDPLAPADRAFLDAARRHLMAHWRYQPASEAGRAVASTIVVTLRFELNG